MEKPTGEDRGGPEERTKRLHYWVVQSVFRTPKTVRVTLDRLASFELGWGWYPGKGGRTRGVRVLCAKKRRDRLSHGGGRPNGHGGGRMVRMGGASAEMRRNSWPSRASWGGAGPGWLKPHSASGLADPAATIWRRCVLVEQISDGKRKAGKPEKGKAAEVEAGAQPRYRLTYTRGCLQVSRGRLTT